MGFARRESRRTSGATLEVDRGVSGAHTGCAAECVCVGGSRYGGHAIYKMMGSTICSVSLPSSAAFPHARKTL